MVLAANGLEVDLTKDEVLVLRLNNPPVNALTPALRGALIAALAGAKAQGARGVVIAGAGRNFSAASAMETTPGGPSLADLCSTIEDMAVPVVVALQGTAVGPGAELALAAHARVMQEGARLVWPDVGLGLVPEAGSTQRLTRLVGAGDALDILLRARPLGAEEALALGVADHILADDPEPAAVRMALAMKAPLPVRERNDGLQDFAANAAAIAAARAEVARGVLPAPGRIVDCVEAALVLPFASGLALESVAREDLAEGSEALALRAVALAERRAAQLPPAVLKVRPKAVAVLGLYGGAPQMAALALIALRQGLQLRWCDPDEARRAASLAWVHDRQDAEVRSGRMSAVQRDADRARLHGAADAGLLAEVDLVVAAFPAGGKPPALRLAAGTPVLALGGGEGLFGLSLAPSARLAELAVPEKGVPPEHYAVAAQFLRRIGITPLQTAKMPIVGRRVILAGNRALGQMLASGVPRRVLSAALDSFGQAMPELPEPAEPAAMRALAEDDVLHRWLGAMANQGLGLLDARVALRPSDIDLALVAGHGFPRWRGGPMHHAATRGLMVLRRDLRLWAKEDAGLWTPHPLLDRMIADGRKLAELDG